VLRIREVSIRIRIRILLFLPCKKEIFTVSQVKKEYLDSLGRKGIPTVSQVKKEYLLSSMQKWNIPTP
jgi:hypothetical protein